MIEKFAIEELFEKYSFEIEFNNDVTLLTSDNGTFKSTSFDILYSISSQKFDNLFYYNFKKITIDYISHKKRIKLVVKYESGLLQFEMISENELFSGFREKILDLDNFKKNFFDSVGMEDIVSGLKMYPLLMIYFPTTRTSKESLIKQTNDIHQYVACIADEVRQVRDTFGKDFKNRVFKEIFTPHVENNMYNLDKNTKKLLKKLPKYSKDFSLEEEFVEVKINELMEYIQDGSSALEHVKKNGTAINEQIANQYVKYYQSLAQIDIISKIVPIFEKWIKNEEDIFKPLELLKHNLENFFSYSDEISFDFENDKLNYYRKDINGNPKRIELNRLSAGELQLIVMIANGYLNNDQEFEILVIDEPELSLHREWKMHLIDELKKMPKKYQIICATHSTEIMHYHNDNVKTINVLGL